MSFGFFPSPIGDELLYSLLARYRAMLGVEASVGILREAFGPDAAWTPVLLPTGLGHLAAALPAGTVTTDEIISRFTAFPYFGAFLSSRMRAGVKSAMETVWFPGFGLDGFVGAVAQHRWLNFCPVCVEDDVAKAGQAAWRRAHQLSGVFVCPEHGVTLRQTQHTSRRHRILATCPMDPGAGEDLKNPLAPNISRSVATATQWLLCNPGEPADRSTLRGRVRELLEEAGWLVPGGRRVKPGFWQEFIRRFGESSLEGLGINRPEVSIVAHKLRCIWQRSDREYRIHPLLHILVLIFLDRHPSDLRRSTPTDRHGGLAADQPAPPRRRCAQRASPEIIDRHRARVERAILANPRFVRSDLNQMVGWSVSYLAEHDPDPAWLAERLPAARASGKRVDWEALDASLARRVPDVARDLLASDGRPKRVTANAILKDIGMSDVVFGNRRRLPRTFQAIAECVETDLACARRRLLWAAEELVRRGAQPKVLDLTTLASCRGPAYRPYKDELNELARELIELVVGALEAVNPLVALPQPLTSGSPNRSVVDNVSTPSVVRASWLRLSRAWAETSLYLGRSGQLEMRR